MKAILTTPSSELVPFGAPHTDVSGTALLNARPDLFRKFEKPPVWLTQKPTTYFLLVLLASEKFRKFVCVQMMSHPGGKRFVISQNRLYTRNTHEECCESRREDPVRSNDYGWASLVSFPLAASGCQSVCQCAVRRCACLPVSCQWAVSERVARNEPRAFLCARSARRLANR